MKMNQFFLTRLLVLALLFFSCSKNSGGGGTTAQDTKLKLKITDDLGNASVGASVILYASLSDYQNNVNMTAIATTDVTGTVTFSNLSAIKYYWFAQKGCLNNVFGTSTTTTALTANVTNSLTCVMAGTGQIKFVNTSTNPYRIYVNGQVYTDLNGGSIQTTGYAAVGSYNIRVLQLSGYLVTPTDKTYTGNVNCGGILTVTFP